MSMSLLEAEIIENLLHSSSISKGIERTMEQIIHELKVDSMYIIHYEEGRGEPEIAYDWEKTETKRNIDIKEYIYSIEEWYHFDEEDIYIAQATMVLPAVEKKLYKDCGYEAVVEFQIKNHGNVVGYILIGWERIKTLDAENANALHVLLKLMSELLVKQFYQEVMGESEERLFKLAGTMTKLMLYMIDEKYEIRFANYYAQEEYPNIKVGDLCYEAIWGEDSPCADCPMHSLEENQCMEQYKYIPYLGSSFHLNATKIRINEEQNGCAITLQKQIMSQPMHHKRLMVKKFVYDLQLLYSGAIAAEILHDSYYDLFEREKDTQYSYSMDFVLNWLEKVHIDDKKKFLECFDINFLQTDYENGIEKKQIDFRYRTQEGKYHIMNAQLLFDQNANKNIIVYILFQDVEETRRVQIEEHKLMKEALMAAKSAAQLKGEILANISHEIQTPMSGIVSMASVARQVYNQEEKLMECLESIDGYADHMMQVMDSLLDAVKVDRNSIVIAKRSFRLERFLNKIDMSVREKIEKKNLQFSVEVKCQFSQVLGDETRLKQAMIILIDNAISYTPISGKIKLFAHQVAVDEKKVYIRFMLDDTGNGFTEKMKESIFGFSHHAESGLIDEEQFNLSLAARIVDLMGGRIGMNIDESGTHLYFTIPFALREEEKNQPTKKKAKIEAGNFKGKRILLAEDSEMGQDALRAVLEVVGFEVDVVDNGKKAVIHFISNPAFNYDAILMDVHMPSMDGREATRCIRISGKEDAETIPIIGLMTNTHTKDIEESLQAGMQEHLKKPVNVEKLYTVLKRVIPD